MKKRTRRFCAVMLAGVLAAGTAISASAASYEAPSAGMEASDTQVKGSAYAASTVILSILGVDITSSNGAGIYNSGGSSSAYGTDSANLGIFGSNINSNPDPYLYNYFYNLYSTQSGGGDYSVDDYAAWEATPYVLRWDSNKQGPQGQASGSTTISIDGTTKTCNPAFYYEPELIIGAASGYSTQLASYQSTYNTSYDPTIISAVSSSGTRSDGLGLVYNMFEMSANLVEIGEAIQEIEDETGKTTRYEQSDGSGSAYEIATEYDEFNRGLYYYAQSAFADGSLTKINYASSVSYDSDTGWAVTQGTGRNAQYASGIGNDIYDLLADGYTFSDGSTVELTTSSSSSDSGSSGPGGQSSQGGGSSTSAYYLSTEQFIEIMTVTSANGTESYGGVVIGTSIDSLTDEITIDGKTTTVSGALSAAGITSLNNLPECVYGITMQTTENGMGIAFYLSNFYYDQNSDLNPVSIIGYWIEHFYHVTDTNSMQTVISNMLSESDLNEAYVAADTTMTLDISQYQESTIEKLMTTGVTYYLSTVEPALDEAGTSSDSVAYWSSLSSEERTAYCETYGHSYADTTVDPTCTEQGYTGSVCTVCGDVGEVYSYTNALGHSYTGTVTAPTCTEAGYTTYVCSTCGDTYISDYVAANGHSYVAGETVAATCTTSGYTVYTCSECDDTYNGDITAATGHSYKSTETQAATCTEQGYTTYTCSDCGATYTTYTSATGHSYAAIRTVEPTQDDPGYTIYICTVCGDTYYGEYTDATVHEHEFVATVVDPTETTAGYTIYTCEGCGTTFTSDYVSATGLSDTGSGEVIEGETGSDDGDTGSTALAAQTITVKKTVTKSFKAKKLKSKKKTFKITAKTSGDGKITFTKKSGSNKLKISKAGKVTVKKGTYKSGKTLKMKVTVKAAKTATYKAASKTITVKVTIK